VENVRQVFQRIHDQEAIFPVDVLALSSAKKIAVLKTVRWFGFDEDEDERRVLYRVLDAMHEKATELGKPLPLLAQAGELVQTTLVDNGDEEPEQGAYELTDADAGFIVKAITDAVKAIGQGILAAVGTTRQ